MEPSELPAVSAGARPDETNAPTSRRGWPLAQKLWAVRAIATVLLGIVMPLYLLLSAHRTVVGLDQAVTSAADLSQVASSLPDPVKRFSSGNDYSLLFSAYVEQGIQRTALNRLRMKSAIMQVGLAISCVGLLFIVFGIDGGGLEASAPLSEKVGVNIKIATSGALVFVLGALLSAGGGLMPTTHTGGAAQFWLGPSSAYTATVAATKGGEADLISIALKHLAQCDAVKSAEEGINCRKAALESAGVGK